jgi:hypothetical protein
MCHTLVVRRRQGHLEVTAIGSEHEWSPSAPCVVCRASRQSLLNKHTTLVAAEPIFSARALSLGSKDTVMRRILSKWRFQNGDW